jgi:hypothetical protein
LTRRKARLEAVARLRHRAAPGAEETRLSTALTSRAVLADLCALACAATVFVATAFDVPPPSQTAAAQAVAH